MGRAVFNALKATDVYRNLKKRDRTVSPEGYGPGRLIFYIPQTTAELEDSIPPPYDRHPRNAILQELRESEALFAEMAKQE